MGIILPLHNHICPNHRDTDKVASELHGCHLLVTLNRDTINLCMNPMVSVDLLVHHLCFVFFKNHSLCNIHYSLSTCSH